MDTRSMIPICELHQQPCEKRSSFKNGGRPYFACSRRAFDCKTFEWADEYVLKQEAPTCLCGSKTAIRTVSGNGARHGRLFFACSQQNRCSFFSWIPEERLWKSQNADVKLTLPKAKENIQPVSIVAQVTKPHAPTFQFNSHSTVPLQPVPHPDATHRELPKPVSDGDLDEIEASLKQLSVNPTVSHVPTTNCKFTFRPTVFAPNRLPQTQTQVKDSDQIAKSNSNWWQSSEFASVPDNADCSIPHNLKSTLFDHQIKGLGWMRSCEKRPLHSRFPSGGILADEMGLGKTVQIVALTLDSSRAQPADAESVRGATLIVCPLAVLDQWEREFGKHCKPDSLSVYKYHGTQRTKSASKLSAFDVVLTTYATITSELRNETKDDGLLHQIKWHRIVIDEGHQIKNHLSKTAKAIFALNASRRWFVSATPLQNGVEDLFSAFKFLQFESFSDLANFKRVISDSGELGIKRLKSELASIMLRRLKSDEAANGQKIISLPPREFQLHRLSFLPQEQIFYSELRSALQSNMKTLILRNDVKRNFQTVLVMLLRLRQTCNHMLLATGLNGGNIVDASVASSASLALHQAAAAAKLPFSSIELPVDDDLSLQMSSMRLDESELESSLDDFESSSCVADADAQSNLAQVSSTKIQWLMRELQRIRTDAPSDKCVIFSQWSSMLNIIQHHLQESKLGFVRLDGDCKISERSQALDSFAESEPAEVFVILVSLKCGGTGLNLTRANHAFMMDSWFNPSIEEQAFDRIYRIGQTKPTFCHKLMISGSVEEKILQMQQRKQKVASKALNSDAAGKKKSIDKVQFSFDDVKSLFF